MRSAEEAEKKRAEKAKQAEKAERAKQRAAGKDREDRRGKQARRTNGVLIAGLVIAVAVLLFSGWQIGKILWGYHRADVTYDEISARMETEMAALPDTGRLHLTPAEGSLHETGEALLEESEEQPEETAASGQTGDQNQTGITYAITVPDFEYLRGINLEIVGWIQIPGTVINYPVVQGGENEFYLTHTYTGEENASGAIFMDAAVTDRFDDKNPILYGHNMKNGAMFSRLNRYARAGFWEEHPFVYITTPDEGQMIFQVFSAYETTPDAPVYYYGFGEDEAYEEYLDRVMGYSIFDADIPVTKEDSIVTLSTCANNTENRFVVHAKRIQ